MATSALSWSSSKKKFLPPERRLIVPTGWLAGPGRWQAPFLFILLVLCIRIRAFKCVNVSPAWPLRFGLFRSFLAQKSSRSARTAPIVWFGTKNVLKKKFAPERTVDQERADNPGSEKSGVGLVWGQSSD